MERTKIRPLVKRGTYEGKYLALYHAERKALQSWLIGFSQGSIKHLQKKRIAHFIFWISRVRNFIIFKTVE